MKFFNVESMQTVIKELTSDMQETVRYELEEAMRRPLQQLEQEMRVTVEALKTKHIASIMRQFETVITRVSNGGVEVTFRIERVKQ